MFKSDSEPYSMFVQQKDEHTIEWRALQLIWLNTSSFTRGVKVVRHEPERYLGQTWLSAGQVTFGELIWKNIQHPKYFQLSDA